LDQLLNSAGRGAFHLAESGRYAPPALGIWQVGEVILPIAFVLAWPSEVNDNIEIFGSLLRTTL